jgi:hypothetical protein
MAKEPKTIKLSDNQECIIHSCGGEQGKKIVIKLLDLMKPEQIQATQTPKERANNLARNLILNQNEDNNFVQKANKLLSELLALAYVKVGENFVELSTSVFDIEFAGRYAQMIELLIEIVEHNGFLEALGYLNQVQTMFKG